VSANASYNYRDGAGVFYPSSLNTGVAWTWQEIVTDLWGKYATPFGSTTAPQFPATPAGTPEGFAFQGVDVWTALNRVVRAAGYVIRYDPTNGQVSIIDPHFAAPAFPPSRVSPRTFDDGLWRVPTDITAFARMPKSLKVSYPVVGSPTALLSSVATVAGQDATGTAAVVWDDMPAFTGVNDAAVTNRTDAVRKMWEIDWLKAANPNSVEFLGWADWVRTAVGNGWWTAWAVYDRGKGVPPGPGGVLTAITNVPPLRVPYEPDGAKYMPAGDDLNTQNVDGTDIDAATTDIRANQATFIEFTSVGGGTPYQRLDLNTAGLCADQDFVDCVQSNMTFDVTVDVPGCLSITLTPTYASTQLGGQDVLTNVTAALTWKTRTLTLPTGTIVGDLGYCVTPDDCCPDGADVLIETTCCPDNDVPRDLTLTVSGTGGGSFPIVESGGNWDTGLVSLTGAGAGTITIRLYCFGGVWAIQNNSGSPDYSVTFTGSGTVECDPFSYTRTGTLVGAGSYNGESRTFTVTY
jgi:hypothetical protein